MGHKAVIKLFKILGAFFVLAFGAPRAHADVTVLLEEPYSYDGALAGTGHTAVYLTRVCAASPTILRRCKPGEAGAVISRYHRIAGDDWIAIPLNPYLYAVDRPDQIPLIADAKLVNELRDSYRRKHLLEIVPDAPGGATPAGDWYQLVGSAYNRTLYGFQVETTPEQDDNFIAAYNSRANRASYKLITRNCADFVRDAVNFYYPKAVKASVIADFGVSTPKDVAQSLVHYAARHAELRFTTFVIPQVPGSMRRSRPVRGLVESVFKAKKYELPLLAFQPFVGGGFAAAYMVSGRFDPSRDAMVFEADAKLARPLGKKEREAYEKGLKEAVRAGTDEQPGLAAAAWQHFMSNAHLQFDGQGRPVLEGRFGESTASVGISRGNVLNESTPRELAQELLVVRLRDELKQGGAPKTSDVVLRRDWKLLKAALSSRPEETTAQSDFKATGRASGLNQSLRSKSEHRPLLFRSKNAFSATCVFFREDDRRDFLEFTCS
jgi:hypothetical protein